MFEQTFGAEAPLFLEIARCESTMRQWGSDGKALRGMVNHADIGILQINEDAHAKEAAKLGLDIYTLNGNLAFAKWLYERDHLRPWAPSVACWGHML